jgi:hypothetical protein
VVNLEESAPSPKWLSTLRGKFHECFAGREAVAEVGEHENGSDSIKTKAHILQFLKDSFADLRKATATLDEKNLMNILSLNSGTLLCPCPSTISFAE